MDNIKKEDIMDMRIIGENNPSKVAVAFDRKETADKAINALVEQAGFSRRQIKMIDPNDKYEMFLGPNLEPENKGIAITLIKSHLLIGGAIFLLSLLVSWLLITIGPVATQSSPFMTFIGVGALGLFLGLLLAGAISLRPDHDTVIAKVRAAKDKGKWGVVVHTTHESKKLAKQILARFTDASVESL